MRFIGPLAARALRRVRRLARCAKGTISVEFALVTSFIFVPLIVVGFDFGSIALKWSQLESAARAGAQYGIRSQTSAIELAAMETAVQNDAGDPTLSPTVTQYCQCPGVSTAEPNCTGSCAGGLYAPMYVELTVTDSVDTMWTYPGLPSPFPITVTAKMRVR